MCLAHDKQEITLFCIDNIYDFMSKSSDYWLSVLIWENWLHILHEHKWLIIQELKQ